MAAGIRSLGAAAARDLALVAALLLLGAAVALFLWLPWNAEAAAPRGTLVVADVRGGALLVLELERPGAPRRIALPGRPHELALLPDGRVAASLERAGALAVVDLASGQVERVELGGTPHGLALSGDVLLVTDRSADVVRRLRLGDWAEQPSWATGADPHAVAALEDGVLAVANATAGTLQLGDRVLKVSALPEAVAASGGEVAVAGAFGRAVERFREDGTPLGAVTVGGRPVRLAYAPDGETLAVALSAAGAVALLERAGTTLRIEVGGVPDGLAFSADGRWLLVGDLPTGTVAVVDLATGRVEARSQVGASAGALLLLAAP